MRLRFLAALCTSFALVLSVTQAALGEMGSHLLLQPERPAAFNGLTVRSDNLVSAFADDFSVNPSSSGRWTIYRTQGDLNAEASWDATAQTLYLTRAVASRGTALFANYPLTTPRWRASFRYRAGGGSGADGFVFMFYKDISTYGQPCAGGGLGFILEQGHVPVSGYGVEFDNYLGSSDPSERHIALVEDTTDHHLAWVNDERTEDNTWHSAQVDFAFGDISVMVDDGVVLSYSIPDPDYSYAGIGFGAGTGGLTNNHVIDDFIVEVDRLTNTISGRVTNVSGQGIPNVSVSANRAFTATTTLDGYYTVGGVITGTYILAPHKNGYTFDPPMLTVTVPPNATNRDFRGIGPPPTHKVMPVWRALLLVYPNTDVTYVDSDGTTRHLVTSRPLAERLKALRAFYQYASFAHDYSDGEALVQYGVIHVERPISSLTAMGDRVYWVSPSDTQIELDQYAPQGKYDSILVHWKFCSQDFSQCIPSGGWGLSLLEPTIWAHGATYAIVENGPDWWWNSPTIGEVWLHEWLHGVCGYYRSLGYTMPGGDSDGGSSHGYTDNAAFYRDLMRGRVLEDGVYTGISPEAWRTGSIFRHTALVFADYFYADTLAHYERTGNVTWSSTSQNIQMGAVSAGDSRMYAPVSFGGYVALQGRVYVPASGTGPHDSISLALRSGQVEYWGELLYGTDPAEHDHITISRNGTWGSLYPAALDSGWYTVKMETDENAGIIRMKVWADGTNEPDWLTSRTLEQGWVVKEVGVRHAGEATTWADDLFAIGITNADEQRVFLPLVLTQYSK